MNIIYISNAFPRKGESSTIYTDLAEALASKGHNIVVVATEEKCKGIKKTEFFDERGLRVLRVKIGNLYNVNIFEKTLTTLFMKQDIIRAIRTHLKDCKFDLILFESPPVTMSSVVKEALKMFGCPSYLMLKDIFPQNAVDIGMMKQGGFINNYFVAKEKEIYSVATKIGCMSQANKDYLIKHNPELNSEKIDIFPNTKKIYERATSKGTNIVRRKLGISDDKVVAVYGGNMGKPQGIDSLIEMMLQYKTNTSICFVLVGRGTEKSAIKKAVSDNKLENVLVIDNLPRDEYELLMSECDIGLIFLDKRFTIPNFPSRVLSYFEYSLPVFAATDKNNDFGDMIINAKAGFWAYSGDLDSMKLNFDKLLNSKELRLELGKNGRTYIEENFSVDKSCDIIIDFAQNYKRNLKVLQINSVCGYGSTGRIATDLSKTISQNAGESLIAFGRGQAIGAENSIRIGNAFDNYFHVFLTRIFDRHAFGSKNATKKLVNKIKEFNPDVIQLHNIHGYYVNIQVLFDFLKTYGKPVVWTLYDCWSFTGHCTHYDYIKCEKWRAQCFECPQKKEYPTSLLADNSKRNFIDKKSIFTGLKNLTIITPSNWLSKEVRQSFLKEYEIVTLSNGIDIEVFKPVENDFKARLGFGNKTMILGLANGWSVKKGLDTFVELSKVLGDEFQIVLVGLSSQQLTELPKNIIGFERTSTIEKLIEVYSAADVFVNPTLEETQGLTNIEALACGTPVITYNSGGSPECVDENCGIIIERSDFTGLVNAIKSFNDIGFTKENCINRAINYDKRIKNLEYIELYKERKYQIEQS